ncbi:hypothetical protein [Rubritalea tangerina]|uniref:Uncharacterized protein n=1 Tax=Rubritalea tangerina TaxID=430798 RepID=A0ABW4ZBI2_9BACT
MKLDMQNFVCVKTKVARVSRYCVCAVMGVISMTALAQDEVSVKTQDAKKMVITATGIPPAAPLFYTIEADNSVRLSRGKVEQVVGLSMRVLQGEAKVMSVELVGRYGKLSVEGEGLKSWSIRESADDGKRYLDLVPKDANVSMLGVVVSSVVEDGGKEVKLMTFGPAGASGFTHQMEVKWEKGSAIRLRKVEGCQPVKLGRAESGNRKKFVSTGRSEVELDYVQAGSAYAEVGLSDIAIEARVDGDGKSAKLRLTGTAVVRAKEGGKVELISGPLAMERFPSGQGMSFALSRVGGRVNETRYTIDFEGAGTYPLEIDFVVGIGQENGWRGLRFAIPEAPVVPISITGIPKGSRFRMGGNELEGDDGVDVWRTFLPASGACALQWKPIRKGGNGDFFYTSQALVDVEVGAGMLRQRTQIDSKVLQGKVKKLDFKLEGEGDVLDVDGPYVGTWMVKRKGEGRFLEVMLNGERETVGRVTVVTQNPLGSFPVKAQPMLITPVGAMRHAGFVRLSNRGAVKLGVSLHEGMMQLAPSQFPSESFGEAIGKQIFVYRFPSADRKWEVVADQILPEVSVNEVLVYKLSETDREIFADVELDIREAPLREWEMKIPAGYAVASVESVHMSQMAVGRTVQDGYRSLKVTFSKEVIGRQLIQVRLARNIATEEGEWELAKLLYPEAKHVRGNIGVEAALGWRVHPVEVEKLVEMPLAYFPKKSTQLQQAYRLREAEWGAKMAVMALEQSVQADVFHLYSLKEGMAYGSVLVNYFVVGAPMHEWRIQVPGLGEAGGVGNVVVEGQNVRSWRQDGELLVVTLHQPTLGGSTLLVSFEQPMSARGAELELGTVRPLDAKNESGFIQVVSPTQVKQEVKDSRGLLKLGATELPVEYRLMSSAPSLAAWQYATRDFSLNLKVEWFAPSDTVEQVVDFASLSTQVSRDGEVVTVAKLFVKTRGRKALEMRLPTKSNLLEVRADGQALNARKDGEVYLLPLPAKDDPNAPVEVQIRYGGAAEDAKRPVVSVPVLRAPVVISEWKVSSDRGYLLHVIGGNVRPVEPNLTETGFEWMRSRMGLLIGCVLLIVAGAWASSRASRGGWKPWVGAVWLVLALFLSLDGAGSAREDRRVNAQSFEVVAPVVSPEKQVMLELSNQTRSAAMRSPAWTAVGALGVFGLVGSLFVRSLRGVWVRSIGVPCIGLGVLGQRGGAILLLSLIAMVAVVLLLQLVWQWWDGVRRRREALSKVAKAATAAVVGMLGLLGGNLEAGEVADVLSQRWEVRGERVYAEANVRWRAEEGESILLVKAPASLTSIEIEGGRVNKVRGDAGIRWLLVAESDRVIEGTFRYEMPLRGIADRSWEVPTGDSAVRKLRIILDREGWEVRSDEALVTKLEGGQGETRVEFQFMPLVPARVHFGPVGRDPKNEEKRMFVESADLYIPAPGVVEGWHRLMVRPVSGEVDGFKVSVPVGMMVGDVLGGQVESWRYDPKSGELSVVLGQPMSEGFQVLIQTQGGLEALPQRLELSPLVIEGADSTVGVLGLAFGNDAQPDAIEADGLSAANISDFDKKLWNQAVGSRRGLSLQKVYRYGKEPVNLKLQVDPVAAELRVVTKQRLSLGEEQMLLAVNAEVDIVRAGVFELRYMIPEGMEVESVSGSALRDWTEVAVEGKRYAVLHLTGRTIGKQSLHLNFTGRSPVMEGSVESWEVPHVELLGAMRQTGSLLVVPEQGIRLRVIERQHVTQQDARQSGTHRKGDLAFRLLQSDWSLKLGIEKLDPWIRVVGLQELGLREGQTRTRLSLDYTVENAAVKKLRLKLPGLDEEEAKTVRASGPQVKEMVAVEGDVWELRLRRGVIGRLQFEVEYQRSIEVRDGRESVVPVEFVGVRQVQHFVSVRSSGRLDIRAGSVMGWRASDWSAVPKRLRNQADSSVPTLCYVISEPEGSLSLSVKRHEIASTLKLRVLSGKLTSLFSAEGAALTLAELEVRVVEKNTMRAVLPEGAQLFSVTVNGESVEVVSQGNEQLFYVTAGAEDSERAEVKLMYRTVEDEGKKIALIGPRFSAPLEKIDWFVSLPEGYVLDSHSGAFDYLGAEGDGDGYGMQEYQSSMNRKRQQQAELAKVQLDQANSWISSGDYKKAEKVLSQVSKNRAADAASNEDARVQLRNLRNQQAIMGLNTRRQKLYLENKSVGNMVDFNDAFEEAANNNPLFQGKDNYHPAQVEQLLMGNSAEEREAMQRIADRMISQQLAAQPAAQTIEVTLPQKGHLLHFSRVSQLNANMPLVLELEIDHPSSYGIAVVLGVLLTLFVGAFLCMMMRRSSRV